MRSLVNGLERFVSCSSIVKVLQSEEVDDIRQIYIASELSVVSEASELTEGSNAESPKSKEDKAA
jgi:hypothetical protein